MSPQVAAASTTNPLRTTYNQRDLPLNIAGPNVVSHGSQLRGADGKAPSKYKGTAWQPIVGIDRSGGMGGLREMSQVMADGQILGFIKSDKEKGKLNNQGVLPCDSSSASTAALNESNRMANEGTPQFAIRQQQQQPSSSSHHHKSPPTAASTYAGRPQPKQSPLSPKLTPTPTTVMDATATKSAAPQELSRKKIALSNRSPSGTVGGTAAAASAGNDDKEQPPVFNTPQDITARLEEVAKNGTAEEKKLVEAAKARLAAREQQAAAEAKLLREKVQNRVVDKEAEDYYQTIPADMPDKDEVWERIQRRGKEEAHKANLKPSAVDPTEVDFLKMEEEIKENDLFHYRVGEMAFPDEALRRDYYSMHLLAMSLNKARWTMMEVHAEKGQKTTGAGMKMMFWKDATHQIIEQRDLPSGQFVDSHPVLRPFAYTVKRHNLTKAFMRGFVDAKLKVVHQPGNIKQLFEIFDKSYGYFYNTMLEILGIKDDGAEHALTHIGRAIGLTQHCVMFWKKYARLGFTMLPADICADNHVNLGLLKNLHLAEKDRYVRRALYDVMSIVKTEMLHAQDIISTCPVEAWPLLMDAFYPNYYLGFLQKHNFNVSKYWADDNIENAGFSWYKWKKVAQWEKHKDTSLLISELAPLPYTSFSLFHKESKYKRSSDMTSPKGTETGNAPESERSRL